MSAELRRRLWGYFFWGLMGLVIAVPELAAAFWDEYVPWPTISGIIGYLEYWHPWVSLIVAGVIVWWALHVIEFGPAKTGVLGVDVEANPTRDYLRTPLGRSTRAKELRPSFSPLVYIPVAILAVVAGSLIAQAIRPDDEFLLGEVLYSLIFVFWIFVPGVLAYFGREIPFPTLFTTFRDLAHLGPFKILAGLIAGGIVVLLIHLVLYPWPSVIPDMQDLHRENERQEHEEKKESEPSPFSP